MSKVVGFSGTSVPEAGPIGPAPVLALHCSGANGSQWRHLAARLGEGFRVESPDLYGCATTGPWLGDRAFRLADEAARLGDLIAWTGRPVHLVGHSYGGGVALRIARERPDAIASLTLYEPSAFHLLKEMGEEGAEAFAEIAALRTAVSEAVVAGAYRRASQRFVDYWGGSGTWASLKPEAQLSLARWIPRAPIDFHALCEEPTPLAAYAGFDFPTLVLRGEYAPRPTRLIAERLTETIAGARTTVVAGAGHMGPLSHALDVSVRIVGHLRRAERRLGAADRTRTVIESDRAA